MVFYHFIYRRILLRIYCIRRAGSYIFSFFGLVDLLALIPTYLELILPGASVLIVIRILRVLRVFRILKLVQFMGEADLLIKAMTASRRKIFVFLFFVINLVIILGSIMYLIEESPLALTAYQEVSTGLSLP